jgi:aspartate kinase
MRRVVKFGGTSIATPGLVREAAQHIARLVEAGEQIAVVVSAPGNATSELLQGINHVSASSASLSDTCEYAALGEEQSVRLMLAALRSLAVNAQPFLPRNASNWPIIADLQDDAPLAALKINEDRPFELRVEQTVASFEQHVLPLLRTGTVPVISGFFATDSAQRIITLGRGGSDITAFIVAQQISADEVVIVTDVQGVLTADPRLAEDVKFHGELSLSELETISSAGARVIHPRALKFKPESLRIRLIDYRELDQLEQSGTSILGVSETVLYRNPDELSMITVVGDLGELVEVQATLLDWLKQQQLQPFAVSMSRRFSCVFLPTQVAAQSYSSLHQTLNTRHAGLTNISLRGGIGELRLRSAKFLEQPGVLAEITGLLANARINIVEMITGLTDISVFILQADMPRAEALLQRVLQQYLD